MSAHNISFHGDLKKILIHFGLRRTLNNTLPATHLPVVYKMQAVFLNTLTCPIHTDRGGGT